MLHVQTSLCEGWEPYFDMQTDRHIHLEIDCKFHILLYQTCLQIPQKRAFLFFGGIWNTTYCIVSLQIPRILFWPPGLHLKAEDYKVIFLKLCENFKLFAKVIFKITGWFLICFNVWYCDNFNYTQNSTLVLCKPLQLIVVLCADITERPPLLANRFF